MGRRRDAYRPGCARRHCLVAGNWQLWFVADCRARVGIEGQINHDLPEKFSITVEYLNTTVATVRDVHISLRIGCDAVRSIELAGLVSRFTPRLEPLAVLINLRDA